MPPSYCIRFMHRERNTIERRYQMQVFKLLILTQTNIYLLSHGVQKNSKEIFWNLKSEVLEYRIQTSKKIKYFNLYSSTCIHFWYILFWFAFCNFGFVKTVQSKRAFNKIRFCWFIYLKKSIFARIP